MHLIFTYVASKNSNTHDTYAREYLCINRFL